MKEIEIYAFTIHRISIIFSKRKQEKLLNIFKNIDGFIGVNPDEKGINIVFDSYDHALEGMKQSIPLCKIRSTIRKGYIPVESIPFQNEVIH